MQIGLFVLLNLAVTALAVLLSLKQRWLNARRTLVMRAIVIWAVAAILVVLAGTLLLGPVSPALSVPGAVIVVVLAAIASAAR